MLGLVGLVAGLCAVFAAAITIIEWRQELAQAGWPAVTGVIQNASVDPSRTSKGGLVWRLHCRVQYETAGLERVATLSSRSVRSERDIVAMRRWAAQHRRNSTLDLRYDPELPVHVVFASDDVPGAGSRTASNITLTLVAAILSVALLAFAKHLKTRSATLDPGTGGTGGRILLGVLCAATGLVPIAIGVDSALHAAHPLTAEDLIFLPAALIFVCGGALVALPQRDDTAHRLLVALLVTAFAVTLDCVAFGPGERRFSGGISLGNIGFGFNPGETFGRILFGIVALGLDVGAIAMWVALIRRRLTGANSG